jgi:hypothetical protein
MRGSEMADEKIDLYKTHKKDQYLAKRDEPLIISLPPIPYLTIKGEGDPSGEDFTSDVGALYAVSFTLKMGKKKNEGIDYKVCQLEGQWWAEGDLTNFLSIPRGEWKYRLMIRVPDFITSEEVERIKSELQLKGKQRIEKVNFEIIDEGTVVQSLHIGPYAEESALIDKMIEHSVENNFIFDGHHHEIYLSDPKRTAPEKLRTILRHPLKLAE